MWALLAVIVVVGVVVVAGVGGDEMILIMRWAEMATLC
jgi:tRNA A22 N-methylase